MNVRAAHDLSHPADPASRPTGVSTLIDDRLQQVDGSLDYLMASMPESRLEARRLCTEILGAAPSPEMLQTLQLMARDDASQLMREGLGRRVVVLRLLTDAVFRELTEPTLLEPGFLRRVSEGLASLREMIDRYRKDAESSAKTAPPSDTDSLRRLERKMMPSTDRIDAYLVLVPLLEELAEAAMHGRITAMPHLSDREVTLFADAIPGRIDVAEPPERVWLNAAALRFGIERDLIAWDEARRAAAEALRSLDPVGAEEDASDDSEDEDRGVEPADAPLEPSADERTRAEATLDPADDPRTPVFARLHEDMNAYKVVVERLQSRQDEARAGGKRAIVERTSSFQKSLFASYLRLSAEARKWDPPGGTSAAEGDAEAEAIRERLIEEARLADEQVGKTTEETQQEVILDALTGLRDGNVAAPVGMPGGEELKQRRKTRGILVALVVILAVASIAVNVTFLMLDRRVAAAAPPSPADYAPAMNVKEADPLGATMLTQVSSIDWNTMTPAEQQIQLDELGRLANDDGFTAVVVTDENGGKLAEWSAGKGSTIEAPAETP